jgi:hypothetical protein
MPILPYAGGLEAPAREQARTARPRGGGAYQGGCRRTCPDRRRVVAQARWSRTMLVVTAEHVHAELG